MRRAGLGRQRIGRSLHDWAGGGAVSDLFDMGTLDGAWSTHGSPTVSLTEGRLSLATRAAAGDGIYRAVPAGNWNAYLKLIPSMTPSGMVGLHVVNSSGTGYGISPYNNTANIYTWTITAWAYAATRVAGAASGATCDIWLRLTKASTVYTLSWATHVPAKRYKDQSFTQLESITDGSFAPASFYIGSLFTNGAATNKIDEFRVDGS